MQKKKLIAQIFLCAGKAVHDFTDRRLFEKGDGVELALYYEKTGADALLVFELSKTLSEREKSLAVLRAIHNSVDIPIIAGGGIDQLKDVEQFLLLGCNRVLLNMNKESNRNMLEQVSEKFGKERIAVCVSEFSALSGEIERLNQCVEEVFLFGDHFHLYDTVKRLPMKCIPIVSVLNLDHMGALLRIENVVGISGKATSATGVKIYELRKIFARQGLFLQSCESAFTWADLKKNSDGLVPVIVQDYKNDQVLMMAYMSEESLEMTLLTGWMTYFSRSRQQLWLKGETSGHFQRVKEILIDCDNDTLLARVIQTGAACHTGNRTCFYREMVSAPAGNKEKIAPLETVLADISERISCADEESNPKKMSDQEMDQVLYKLGKSTIGLLLSAKSHDEKTVRKQSCDCLFELMVLMKQLGITWEELSGEFQTYDFQIEV